MPLAPKWTYPETHLQRHPTTGRLKPVDPISRQSHLCNVLGHSIQFPRPSSTPVAAPVALEKINHHQPSHLVASPGLHVACLAETYSLFVTTRIVRDAIWAPAPVAGTSVEIGAGTADTSAIPAFAGHGGFVRLERLGTAEVSGSSARGKPRPGR